MPVYVIGGTDGPVKIGYAADPWRRLQKMQSDNRDALRVLALVGGDKGTEAELHARFAAARVRGEWFSRTAALLSFIAGNAAGPRPMRKVEAKAHPLERYRRRHGLTLQALGGNLEMSISTISRIIDGKVEPTFAFMRRVCEMTGGEIRPDDFVFWSPQAADAHVDPADGAYLALVAA
jgi:DNA-binding XRE family transcriptional regulator